MYLLKKKKLQSIQHLSSSHKYVSREPSEKVSWHSYTMKIEALCSIRTLEFT